MDKKYISELLEKRKRLMNYLKKNDAKKYASLVKKLGLNA